MQYPGTISSKLSNTGITIFESMSALSNNCNAINLSQGFPDFYSSPYLIELVNKYMKKGFNQYAPMYGIQKLRKVIADKIERLYGCRYNFEKEICITPGATYGIYTAIISTIKKDDEVIIFTPAYDSYSPTVILAGGVPVYVELDMKDYSVNWAGVREMITPRTRMIIINSPHNPTGSILTKRDMESLENITKDTDIIILSDEVYEHIIFDDNIHESVTRYQGLAERSFVVYSFGKTFHTTGWKIGYCLAPENMMAEFVKVHQFNVFTSSTPFQYALADYLEEPENYTNLGRFYQEKRDFFINGIKESRFKMIPSYGTYFILLDYSNITDEKDIDFAIRVTKEFNIASIPISVFYHREIESKALRFCFAKTTETLAKALKRLCRI